MTLITTTLYALPLTMIWFALWVNVSRHRAALSCSIGDADDKNLLQVIRRHGNFIEWVPFVLLLMVLAEAQGADAQWLHAAGILLVLGRIVHPFGLAIHNAGHPLRYLGNGSNMLAVLILLIPLVRIVTGL
ncbi:MAPEG family protein [Devosia sp. BSSL-BM10]|uniref:MAPEG family protein n=1 Tax=Devosia litorisediminis TaxID=2829817 RepID=A0A942I656_9HYPH|nr:MAPEG family protein [Devosia litorisediminis]MBS3848962.1 MAPEG family protein [Devosia litorisediminis]